jgi:hypothetical protein
VVHVQENAAVDQEKGPLWELFLDPVEGNPDAKGPSRAGELRVVAAGDGALDLSYGKAPGPAAPAREKKVPAGRGNRLPVELDAAVREAQGKEGAEGLEILGIASCDGDPKTAGRRGGRSWHGRRILSDWFLLDGVMIRAGRRTFVPEGISGAGGSPIIGRSGGNNRPASSGAQILKTCPENHIAKEYSR